MHQHLEECTSWVVDVKETKKGDKMSIIAGRKAAIIAKLKESGQNPDTFPAAYWTQCVLCLLLSLLHLIV